MSGAKDASAEVEAAYQAQLEAGEVVQMMHPGKGLRYITNEPAAIAAARKRGYTDVEYSEKTVKVPVVKAADPKPKRRTRSATAKPEEG